MIDYIRPILALGFAIVLAAMFSPASSSAVEVRAKSTPHVGISVISTVLTGSEEGPISLCKLSVDNAKATLHIIAANDSLTSEGKDINQAPLVLRHRSKGLGEITSREVGKIWLANESLYLQWNKSPSTKEAAEQLKYSALIVRGQDGHDLAVCHFVLPQAISLRLRGTESARLETPADLCARLKILVEGLPNGWEQKTAEDGQQLALTLGSSAFAFELREGGTSLQSRADASAAAAKQDPWLRVAALGRQIAMDKDRLTRLQADFDRADVQEQTSIQKTIQSVQGKIETMEQLRQKLTDGAAGPGGGGALEIRNAVPAGAALRLVLPNGVCVAKIEFAAEPAAAAAPGIPPPPADAPVTKGQYNRALAEYNQAIAAHNAAVRSGDNDAIRQTRMILNKAKARLNATQAEMPASGNP